MPLTRLDICRKRQSIFVRKARVKADDGIFCESIFAPKAQQKKLAEIFRKLFSYFYAASPIPTVPSV